MHSHRVAALSTVLFAFAVFSCDTDVDNTDPDAEVISAQCLEAEDHSDLEWIQDNVFTRSCAAFNACHRGAALSALQLNLEAGMTEANTVNVAAQTENASGFNLVVPGDPAQSYMMVALGARPGPIGPAGTMPFNSPLLCSQKLDAIERWINSL